MKASPLGSVMSASSPPNTAHEGTRLRSRRRRLLDHLWGPTGSALLHLLVVALLVKYVVTPERRPEPAYEVILLDPADKVMDPPEPRPPEKPTKWSPDQDLPMPVMPEVRSTDEMFDEVASMTAPEALPFRVESLSPLPVPWVFADPGPDWRRRQRDRHNPPQVSRQIEGSVVGALQWLQRNQREDGSWEGTGGAASAVGMTGMALVAFLSHGETHQSQAFGDTVRRAIDFLVAQQQPDGSFLSARAGQGHARTYANGMAAYALGEAYALTRIPSLRPVMENGVRFILQGMQDTGGFTYEYARTERRDTSVAGWQVQAMKAAVIARADVPGLRERMQLAAEGMKMNFAPDRGMFRYAPPEGGEPGRTCTAIGVLSLQLLGHRSDAQVTAALATLTGIRCDWTEPALGSWPMYTWYYLGQALLHSPRSAHFEQWNRGFAAVMVRNQNADGSWTPVWGAEREYGPVYGTVFGATSLMVYYKMLPVLKNAGQEDAFDETQPDDILIEFG